MASLETQDVLVFVSSELATAFAADPNDKVMVMKLMKPWIATRATRLA